MNLSETAFLLPENGGYRLRWMTPAVEVDLCGHATLASAHVLFQTGRAPKGQPIRFHTRSGELRASDCDGRIELDFPALSVEPSEPSEEVLAALGHPTVVAASGSKRAGHLRYLLELESEAAVRAVKPDFPALKAARTGVIVTAKAASSDIDFVSRYFAPWFGVDEDPVTGSAHCALATYWSQKLGRTTLTAFQASARGGFLYLRLDGDRVRMQGRAITVTKGELAL